MINKILLLFITFNLNITQASWYGECFHGRITASGVEYDMNKMVAASPTLPFGTMVEVTNLENNKTVLVEIIDRGPFAVYNNGILKRPLEPHPTRGLDLSKAAFAKIADLDIGVIQVEYKILD